MRRRTPKEMGRDRTLAGADLDALNKAIHERLIEMYKIPLIGHFDV